MNLPPRFGALIAAFVFAGLALYSCPLRAQPVNVPCPNDEPCKVLVITKTEENVLTGENGILATAAQARNLDLGQFVSYFRQKIALAPAGQNAAKPEALKDTGVPPKQPEAAKKQP